MAVGKPLGIWEIEDHIKKLKDVKSNKRSLLSLVISPREGISDVSERLEKWLTNIESEKSQEFYMDAKEAIGYAQQKLQRLECGKVPDNGLIIYTGIIYTDDGREDVEIGFEPFKLIYAPYSRILDTFDIEPLSKLLESEPEYQERERSRKIKHQIEHFKHHIEPLIKDVKSNKRSLLSLFISPREEIFEVIMRLETDIENKESKNAKEAIDYAKQKLQEYHVVPDNGLIIYAGIIYTDDGREDRKIGFEPFKLIDDTFHQILDTFDTRLLESEPERSEPSTQLIRSRKEEAKPVNPQSFAYFSFLFAVVGIITFLLGAVRPLLRQNPSFFKDHGGVFTIMIIVSGCMAVLSSFVLVLSSFLLKNWMKKIHYTILKTIGSFSAILVPFSLGAAVFVPSGDLNWIAYTVLFVIFGGLLYLYSFIWKVACAYHQGESYNSYPVHWAYLLIILVPLSISLLSFFSSSLWWLAGVFVSFSIIAFMRFNREDVIAFPRFNREDVIALYKKCLRLLSSRGSTEKTR